MVFCSYNRLNEKERWSGRPAVTRLGMDEMRMWRKQSVVAGRILLRRRLDERRPSFFFLPKANPQRHHRPSVYVRDVQARSPRAVTTCMCRVPGRYYMKRRCGNNRIVFAEETWGDLTHYLGTRTDTTKTRIDWQIRAVVLQHKLFFLNWSLWFIIAVAWSQCYELPSTRSPHTYVIWDLACNPMHTYVRASRQYRILKDRGVRTDENGLFKLSNRELTQRRGSHGRRRGGHALLSS
jgi:hypothetical protein